MKDSMAIFLFFGVNLVQNIKIDYWSWNLAPRLIRKYRIRWWFSVFTFLDWKHSFGLIWSKNSKFLVSAKFWYLGHFEYVKFDGDGHFSVLGLFLQVLSEKPIWHFWLISQQFTRRDLFTLKMIEPCCIYRINYPITTQKRCSIWTWCA